MKTKEQIMNEYAVSKGYINWGNLMYENNGNLNELSIHFTNVTDLIQKELLNKVAREAIRSSEKESILNIPIL